MKRDSGNLIIIGAGPSGMACAYSLAKEGKLPLVLENDKNVGGLCQTIDFNGYLFDLGGHRFLSKSEIINELWQSIIGEDLLRVKRISRIYYKKKFFKYPLSFIDTLRNLGVIESSRCVLSYLHDKFIRPGNDNTFEGWMINRFGKRLYEIFFNSYSQKVWAIPCKEISSDWAIQRIQGLSLKTAIKKAILRKNTSTPKTLSDEFGYPKRGSGQFYNKLKKLTAQIGAEFAMSHKVIGIIHNESKIISLKVEDKNEGEFRDIPVKYLFSSMPLTEFLQSMLPEPPKDILHAAKNLKFRSFLVVNIIVNKKNLFPDQWIYIHAPEIKLSRIQNYKNWSPSMTIDPEKSSLGLEYFCTEGDSLWKIDDIDMIDFALEELEKIGIVSRKHINNGFVVRRANAYPIYSLNYKKHIRIIRDYFAKFSNFQTMGRAGMFRYGNSDHAMLSGYYAAKRYLSGNFYNIWDIGSEKDYFEA